jgi:hypothetical protein
LVWDTLARTVVKNKFVKKSNKDDGQPKVRSFFVLMSADFFIENYHNFERNVDRTTVFLK